MTPEEHNFLAPLFLGASGENGELVERLLVNYLRDHIYWRRNFHPEDPVSIHTVQQHQPSFVQAAANMEQALNQLSASLKKSTPFFSPRYVGHMASDCMLPGLLAQMLTILYNPNNVAVEGAPATLDLEVQVGRQLAAMFGMPVDSAAEIHAWGHITSGGTVANYEALWLLRAVRFYPLAVAAACHGQIDLTHCGPAGQNLDAYSPWELINFPVNNACALKQRLNAELAHASPATRSRIQAAIVAHSFEHLGLTDFQRLHGVKSPWVIVPATAHYSWKKAMQLLGMGTQNLRLAPVDQHMRVKPSELADILEHARLEQRPVLAMVGVLGTTEFGTIDPIHELIRLRERFLAAGLAVPVHVDAAWGGYLATLFRREDGGLVERRELRQRFKYFPSHAVYDSFTALDQVDSITVDPHKLGYVPYGAGAYVARDHRMTEFVGTRPVYIYDDASPAADNDRLQQLGDYILEGSKPGANAAAAFVTHRITPLNEAHFGRLCATTIKASEYLFDKLRETARMLQHRCRLRLPMEPDSNLICLAVNPTGNQDLAVMNRFTRRLYQHFAIDPGDAIQKRDFMGSHTSLLRCNLSDAAAQRIATLFAFDPATFVRDVENSRTQSNHLFLLRHTLMNPWLTDSNAGENYLDRYCDYLRRAICAELAACDSQGRGLATP